MYFARQKASVHKIASYEQMPILCYRITTEVQALNYFGQNCYQSLILEQQAT